MVKRYDPCRDLLGLMEEDETGNYVEFKDYKKLMDIANRLDEALDLHMGEFCESKLRSKLKVLKNG